MQIASIELYDLLKIKLGEREAKALVTFVETEVENKLENKKDIIATKQDIATLRVEMSEMKSELIKWMFIFIMGQMIAQVGIIVAVLKLFFH